MIKGIGNSGITVHRIELLPKRQDPCASHQASSLINTMHLKANMSSNGLMLSHP